MKEGMAL
jgi:hypothetical protein